MPLEIQQKSLPAWLNGKAKDAFKAKIAKEKSTAKTAAIPPKKAKTAKQMAKVIEEAKIANAKWERPSRIAICRYLTAGDLPAACLLAHFLYEWNSREHKLSRHGQEWLAHTRKAWAQAAGLSFAEFTKRALPRVKKHCWGFLRVKAMGNGEQKKVWVSIDVHSFQQEALSCGAYDVEMQFFSLNGTGLGKEKQPANYYGKNWNKD